MLSPVSISGMQMYLLVTSCIEGNVSHVVEEKLVEEKKKNLEILQSVLNITKQPGVAEGTKSKIFR